MTPIIVMFYEFFKIGLFSVGGGLATLPFLYDLARRYDWFTMQDVSTMVAISESTPGPMGINMATYVGFLHSGLLGAVLTPIFEVMPAIIIILIIAKFLQKFRQSALFNDIFYGLRPASTAMIVTAGLSIVKLAFFGEAYTDFFWQGAILAVILYVALKKFKLHPVIYIAASAVIGILFKFSV